MLTERKRDWNEIVWKQQQYINQKPFIRFTLNMILERAVSREELVLHQTSSVFFTLSLF